MYCFVDIAVKRKIPVAGRILNGNVLQLIHIVLYHVNGTLNRMGTGRFLSGVPLIVLAGSLGALRRPIERLLFRRRISRARALFPLDSQLVQSLNAFLCQQAATGQAALNFPVLNNNIAKERKSERRQMSTVQLPNNKPVQKHKRTFLR